MVENVCDIGRITHNRQAAMFASPPGFFIALVVTARVVTGFSRSAPPPVEKAPPPR
jgi:hypothetical protein